MENKANQSLKGNNNTQIIINNNGLKTEEVISLIQSYCNPNRDEIITIVKEAIEEIKIENFKKPDKRVFVPLIQQLSYSLEEEYLKNTYKELLKSSMDSTKNIHPSFVSIINQLTPDEIRILNSLRPTTMLLYPLVDLNIYNRKIGGLINFIKNQTSIGHDICEYPDRISEYIENLERLKLIEIPNSVSLLNKKEYRNVVYRPDVISRINKIKKTMDIDINYQEKTFRLTNFGVQFIKTCLGDSNPNK